MRAVNRLSLRRTRNRSTRRSNFPTQSAERLESRCLLTAFDVVDIDLLRADPTYSEIDGGNIGAVVIDTGLLGNHPDLQNNFVAWFDAVSNGNPNAPGSTNPNDSIDPDGHGTHVAGTVGSSNANLGVAPSVDLIGIRGLLAQGESRPNHDPVLVALQWVARNQQRYNIRVVNMSLGTPTNFNTIPQANDYSQIIDSLENMGVTVVSAGGNSYAQWHTAGVASPGVFSSLVVANTWEDNGTGDSLPSAGGGGSDSFFGVDLAPTVDQLAATSQRSSLPHQVAAPGSTILSTWNNSQGQLYNTISGTSMASPLVAGMVALMQDAAFTFGGRYLSTQEVVDIVIDTSDQIVDRQNPNTLRVRVAGGQIVEQEDLRETGLTFNRVNVFNAVERVRDVVTQGGNNPDPDPGARTDDTNNTIQSAVDTPALDATNNGTELLGRVSTDGNVNVGATDVDLFRVNLQSPGRLTVATRALAGGTPFDAYLRLFDANGNQIAVADDFGTSLYPILTTDNPLPAGTYFAGISGFENTGYNISNGASATPGETGDYVLTLSLSNPDPNGVIQGAVKADLTTANILNPNQALVDAGVPVATYFGGLIDSDPNPDFDPEDPNSPERITIGATDVDFFEVIAPDTGVLITDIDAVSVYGQNAVDSYVEIYDENFQLLGLNDDDGTTLDSYLELNVNEGQKYFVAVTTFGNRGFNPMDPFDRSSTTNATGAYDLYLSFFNGDVNGTVYGAPRFEDFQTNNSVQGTIGADFGNSLLGAPTNGGYKDVDFFTYTATQSGLLEINADGEGNFNPTLGLWNVTSEDVNLIADTIGEAPQLIHEITAGQTFYVSVTGAGNSGFNWFTPASGSGGEAGNYSLSATIRSSDDLRVLSNNSIQLNTPEVISAGDRVSERIGFDNGFRVGASDVDVYSYSAPTTGRLQINVDASTEGSTDPFLRFFDNAGAEIGVNDNTNSTTRSSRLIVNIEAGEQYYIGINGSSASAGNYNPLTGAGATPGPEGDYFLSLDLLGDLDLDIDSDGVSQALTDGILTLRFLAGFTGSALTNGAAGAGATRTDQQIVNHLNSLDLDVDGDSQTLPLTDGLLALRFLAGFSGEVLVAGAVSEQASRTTPQQISAFLSGGGSSGGSAGGSAGAAGIEAGAESSAAIGLSDHEQINALSLFDFENEVDSNLRQQSEAETVATQNESTETADRPLDVVSIDNVFNRERQNEPGFERLFDDLNENLLASRSL